MNAHQNARTTPLGRATLVRRVLEEGWSRKAAGNSGPENEVRTIHAAVNALEKVKPRADFEVVYLKKFLQSLDLVLPGPDAQPFRGPAKRFAHLMRMAKERYKDDTLDISGVGGKVTALINKHLVELGIDPTHACRDQDRADDLRDQGDRGQKRAHCDRADEACRKAPRRAVADMKRQIDDLTFSVVRSRRRTADIVVERDSRVVVRAPESVSAEAIDDAVRGNAAWVHRTIAEWEELNAARRRRAFVQGSSFLYLGRNYRLRFVTAPSRPLTLKNGWFDLDERVAAEGGAPAARKAFRDF